MNNYLIKNKISEVMEAYPLEKYPNAFGVYKEGDENIVGYLYQKEDNKWHNNLNNETYFNINPVEHIYNVLSKGFQPFYISDDIHEICWRETDRMFDDLDDLCIDRYYHGRKLYFEYCKMQGIDSHYMANITETDIKFANEKFQKFDELLSSSASKKIEECAGIEPITLQNYEYLLNEPYYENLELGYTIVDKNQHMTSVFSYDDHCHVAINPAQYPDILDLSDWGFDFESDVFQPLESGSRIKFMAIDMHINIILQLNDCDTSEYAPDIQKGIKKYLTYCKRTHIEHLVPTEYKQYVKAVYEKYDLLINEKNKNSISER